MGGCWGVGGKSEWSKVDKKVKAAFTREFKKKAASHQYPYQVEGMIKKGKKVDKVQAETVASDEESDDEEVDVDLSKFKKDTKSKVNKTSSSKVKKTKKLKK